jgi:DNA-binding XRE family transcriptional regulator
VSGRHKFRDLRRDIDANPERLERVKQMKQAMLDSIKLAQLRERRIGSQQNMAARITTSQARVSQIERGEDLYLSTLDRYITAMGGELKVVAEFPDETVTLTRTD